MDRTGKIAVSLSFVLLVLWTFWFNKNLPKRPQGSTNGAVASVQSNTPTPTGAELAPAAPGANPPAAPASQFIGGTGTEQLQVLENDAIRLTVTSVGGGLREAQLKAYQESIPCGPNRRFATTNAVTLNRAAPLPAFLIGGGIDDELPYQLTRTAEGIRAEKTTRAGLRIVKEYALATNHQFTVSATLENRGASPVPLPSETWNIGTATPLNAHDDGQATGVMWFDGNKNRSILGWVSTPGFLCIPTTPRAEATEASPSIIWAATHNQYFSLIAVPDRPATNLHAHRVELPSPSEEQLAADPQAVRRPAGVQTSLSFPGSTIAPGQSLHRRFHAYAGPKEYYTLQRLEPRLDLIMDYTGFSGFFAKLLLLAMNGLHQLGLGYGWCIVLLTVIIKLVFWPLTAASTRSMKRMGELQPQMKAIQEKYKDDPKKMNQKTLEFMREHRINPAAGCLPLLVQIPIFFGLFAMLRSAIELRGASFLWMCDLAAPDTLFVIPGIMIPFNLMPILYIASALWQSHMTPMSPQMDPVQQQMMRYMPLMFLVIFYNYSCGLALYWTVQNLLTILQMKLTGTTTPVPAAPAAAAPSRPGPRQRQRP